MVWVTEKGKLYRCECAQENTSAENRKWCFLPHFTSVFVNNLFAHSAFSLEFSMLFLKQTHVFRAQWHNNYTSVCLFCNFECRWFHQSMLNSDWSSKQLIIVSHNAIVLDIRQWVLHRAYPCYETLHPCCAKLIVPGWNFRIRLCLNYASYKH